MSKKAAVNSFTEGLQCDLHPLTTPNNVLTDALNATVATMSGDEMILQNDFGNVTISYKDRKAQLKDDYIPCGIAEYGGVVYIASYDTTKKDNDGNNLCELGCFPSPDWDNGYFNDENEWTGNMIWDYSPLMNLSNGDSCVDCSKFNIPCIEESCNNQPYYCKFNTGKLKFNLQYPVNIEVQKSYDGSVNLILNDNYNIPRLINTRFTVLAGNKYKIVDRTGNKDTNIYDNSSTKLFDLTTSLNKRIQNIPKISFLGVSDSGDLKVGNYVFYFKYSDADGNETDFIAESGIVSCFQGSNADPYSIDGGWRDYNSHKVVNFQISNIDSAYDYFTVYYSRTTSDLDQNRTVEVKRIDKRFPITNNDFCSINITGNETLQDCTTDELNTQYTILNKAKSHTQAQNMLFSANIGMESPYYNELTDLSLRILPFIYKENSKDRIGEVSDYNYVDSIHKEKDNEHIYPYEYYNVKNIYYNLGYWDKEIYRLGVVYIFEDGSLSPVYNIRGRNNIPITTIIDTIKNNYTNTWDDNHTFKPTGPYLQDSIDCNGIMDGSNLDYFSGAKEGESPTLENRRGVVRFDDSLVESRQLYSIGTYIDDSTKTNLKNYKVKGLFFVRQKRMPTILAQAYLMPRDYISQLPIIFRDSSAGKNNSTISDYFKVKDSMYKGVYQWKIPELNVIGESFIFNTGYYKETEFNYKNTKEAALLRNPYGDASSSSMTTTKTYQPGTLDSGLAYSYIATVYYKNEQYGKYNGSDLDTYYYSILYKWVYYDSSGKELDEVTLKGVYDNNERTDSNKIEDTWNTLQKELQDSGLESTSEIMTNDVYNFLDYEGRLFYFPPFQHDSQTDDNIDSADYYTKKSGEKYITFFNKHKAWCGICPDFYIKQSYYNQFFTGTKFFVSLAPINTSFSYLLQGDYNSNKYRYYYVGIENYTSINNSTLQPFYVVSLTDSMPISSTNNNTESIFRATAGIPTEAYRLRYYYKQQPDDKKDATSGSLGSEAYDSDFSRALVREDLFNTNQYVRGLYSAYLGISTDKDNSGIGVGKIINIYTQDYKTEKINNYFDIRISDSSAYYPISDRMELKDVVLENKYFRGDCYISTFTERLNRNFQDSNSPTNDIIVDNYTFNDNYKLTETYGSESTPKVQRINTGDVNAVKLGNWITFRCCTNYNLSIRSLDESHTEEMAQTGLARGFYPLQKCNAGGTSKIPESQSMNDGFNSTVGEKYYFTKPDTPYIKNEYKNRVYYSDIAQENSFQNGYRITKSTHFRDYNPEYGQINKIIGLDSNLFIVFDHAIGIANIREKNLITEAEQSQVYINSNNVLPERLTIISDTIGSQWQDSVVKTPYAIYGVDTVAKKIWKYEDQLEILSDFKISRFLNNNIDIKERDNQPYLGLRNVKTHYNAYKSDVMFTFENNNRVYDYLTMKGVDKSKTSLSSYLKYVCTIKTEGDKKYLDTGNVLLEGNHFSTLWNVCYNEVIKNFITFYSWFPSYSTNIDNMFLSFDSRYSRNLIYTYSNGSTVYPDVENIPDTYTITTKGNPPYTYPFIWKHGSIDSIHDINGNVIPRPHPTDWYGRINPFEFEFVVLEDGSQHKIFENLQIVANKAEPESFHFEITGDAYEFHKDKKNIYYRQEATKNLWNNMGSDIVYDSMYTKIVPNWEDTILERKDTSGYSKSTIFPLYYRKINSDKWIDDYYRDYKHDTTHDYKYLSGSEIKYDSRDNEYNILTHIKCAPINKSGRLRGNCHYKENRWDIQIPSIAFKQKNEDKWTYPPIIVDCVPNDLTTESIDSNKLPEAYKNTTDWTQGLDLSKWTSRKESRMRDKYCRIRIRYSGKDLAIISAVRTIFSESYA